jgi:hypothetical protein
MCQYFAYAFCRTCSTKKVYIHRTKSYLFASLWSSSWNCSGWWQVCVNCFMWLCRNTVHISNTTVDRHRADKTRVSVIRILKWRKTYISGITIVSVMYVASWIMYSSIAWGSFLSKTKLKQIKIHWTRNIQMLQTAVILSCKDHMSIIFCTSTTKFAQYFLVL